MHCARWRFSRPGNAPRHQVGEFGYERTIVVQGPFGPTVLCSRSSVTYGRRRRDWRVASRSEIDRGDKGARLDQFAVEFPAPLEHAGSN